VPATTLPFKSTLHRFQANPGIGCPLPGGSNCRTISSERTRKGGSLLSNGAVAIRRLADRRKCEFFCAERSGRQPISSASKLITAALPRRRAFPLPARRYLQHHFMRSISRIVHKIPARIFNQKHSLQPNIGLQAQLFPGCLVLTNGIRPISFKVRCNESPCSSLLPVLR